MVDSKQAKQLNFNDFKKMAQEDKLSCHEKIGFPDSYREGKERVIFSDILTKLPNLAKTQKVVMDVGVGCGALAQWLIQWCEDRQHQLILIDSEEMLALLPNKAFITKIPAFYPSACEAQLIHFQHKVDVIISYSVLQYVFCETNIYFFLDYSLGLLAEEGQMLLGDIPNVSKRKRFLQSLAGKHYHQCHYDSSSEPEVIHNIIEHQQIDDAVVFSLLQRSRLAGFDAYVLPQAEDLPMANRREDILIVKP